MLEDASRGTMVQNLIGAPRNYSIVLQRSPIRQRGRGLFRRGRRQASRRAGQPGPTRAPEREQPQAGPAEAGTARQQQAPAHRQQRPRLSVAWARASTACRLLSGWVVPRSWHRNHSLKISGRKNLRRHGARASVATGAPFAGRSVFRKGAVLWLAAEGEREVDKRIRAAVKALECDPDEQPIYVQIASVPKLLSAGGEQR